MTHQKGNKSMKTMATLFLILFITVVSLSGCETKSKTESQYTTVSPPVTPPIEIKIDFPDGAPPLNQTTKLTCTIATHYISMKDMNVEITLPDGLELISGQLSWTGEVAINSSVQAINAEIKSVKLGNWTASIQFHITPIAPGGYGGDGVGQFYIAVFENAAEWSLYNPLWLESTPSVPVQPGTTGTIPATEPFSSLYKKPASSALIVARQSNANPTG